MGELEQYQTITKEKNDRINHIEGLRKKYDVDILAGCETQTNWNIADDDKQFENLLDLEKIVRVERHTIVLNLTSKTDANQEELPLYLSAEPLTTSHHQVRMKLVWVDGSIKQSRITTRQ